MKHDNQYDIDNEKNVALYSKLLQKHGNNFEALNWGSEESQKLRFGILAEVGIQPLDYVLDVGCGLADFYQWFKDENLNVNYTGLDLTPAMVASAKGRFPALNCHVGTIENHPGEYDYIVASGIFAHRQAKPETFLNETISEMYMKCRKGVAFNCLSTWREDQDEGEFYADPIKTLEFCQKLTKYVVLRHDYHHGDFTIYLYKNNPKAT